MVTRGDMAHRKPRFTAEALAAAHFLGLPACLIRTETDGVTSSYVILFLNRLQVKRGQRYVLWTLRLAKTVQKMLNDI